MEETCFDIIWKLDSYYLFICYDLSYDTDKNWDRIHPNKWNLIGCKGIKGLTVDFLYEGFPTVISNVAYLSISCCRSI